MILKYNFSVGESVVLDEGWSNSSTVKILRISPAGMFACVYIEDPEDYWEVMTYRLSPTIK